MPLTNSLTSLPTLSTFDKEGKEWCYGIFYAFLEQYRRDEQSLK